MQEQDMTHGATTSCVVCKAQRDHGVPVAVGLSCERQGPRSVAGVVRWVGDLHPVSRKDLSRLPRWSATLAAAAVLGLFAAHCAAQSPQADLQTFWTEFRAAALAGDATSVAALTHFPFETRGPLDADPIQTHDRAGFAGLFGTLLDQDPGLRPEPETMRALIKRTEGIDSKTIDPGGMSARVGVFVFRKIDGRWWFTRAYVEE